MSTAKQPTPPEAPEIDHIPEVEAPDITQTPEFQMALANATAAVSERLIAEVKEIMASAPVGSVAPQSGNDAMSLARMIAASVAEMADQGTSRKRVAPEILAGRAEAQKKMEALLLQARQLPKDKRPKYRLIAKFYAKDAVIDPFHRDPRTRQVIPTDIYFLGVPNQAMRPLNAAGKAIYAAYQGAISNGDSEVPIDTKPVWVTDSGVVIAGPAPLSVQAHGNSIDPLDLDDLNRIPAAVGAGQGDDDDDEMLGFVDQNDPRAKEIHVLGTIAKPAQRGMSHEKLA